MKIAVISDIHANAQALRAVLDAIALEGVDRIVCLGDVTGYNTDADRCVALLREAGALCIAGNHDRAVLGAIGTDGFTEQARRAVAWTEVRLGDTTRAFLQALPLKLAVDGTLVAVHGALHPDVGCELVRLDDDRKRALSFDALAVHPSGARVCAFGHTHRPGAWERDGAGMRFCGDQAVTLRPDAFYLVNPGSVGESRTDDERASFLVLDTVAAGVRFHRVAYDRQAVRAKTRKAGLGPRLGWIPPPLRVRLIEALRRIGLYERVVVGFRLIDRIARR
ncbi:MAG TPA: metallophosphoesterase family protein [Ramlibacter sp.]|nr:metallophosphoesterase family protein [Ramlibacter sp.]